MRGLEQRVARVLLVAVTPDLGSTELEPQPAGGTFDAGRLSEEASDLLDGPTGMSVEVRTTTGDPAMVLVEVAREVAASTSWSWDGGAVTS